MKNELVHRADPAVRRWIVVDDNEEVLRTMALTLERISDAEIVCFHSGATALEAFSASPESFEFVVTDFDMPGMNGVELCRRMRAVCPSAKIVLATGSNCFTEAEGLYNGFRTVIAKPFTISSVERALSIAGVLEPEALCAA